MLDGALYFQGAAVMDREMRDTLAFVTVPACAPELNLIEECWRQLQAALSNRFFGSLTELTAPIDAALDQLSVPRVSNYF